MRLYCCECNDVVVARLTTGAQVYWGKRPDLNDRQFWMCDRCKNYVGCHSGSRTSLGAIPTRAMRSARVSLHKMLDAAWKSGRWPRSLVYKKLSDELGMNEFHVGETRSIAEISRAVAAVQRLFYENGELKK